MTEDLELVQNFKFDEKKEKEMIF